MRLASLPTEKGTDCLTASIFSMPRLGLRYHFQNKEKNEDCMLKAKGGISEEKIPKRKSVMSESLVRKMSFSFSLADFVCFVVVCMF